MKVRTHRLHKFDPTGTFLWSRGGYGSGPGQFDVPVAVEVAPSGDVYASDRRNARVQKFDPAPVSEGPLFDHLTEGLLDGLGYSSARDVYLDEIINKAPPV